MADFQRPWCCPERRCAVLWQDGGPPDPDKPGESWVCFGKMPAAIEFVYDGEKYTNFLNSCHFTPLKRLGAVSGKRRRLGARVFCVCECTMGAAWAARRLQARPLEAAQDA